MGEYTPTQRYYLIDGEELVNVDQDINYNWQRADTRIKPLVQIQTTDVGSITGSSVPRDVGYKWYKTYSNSLFHYSNDIAISDNNGRVAEWSTSGITFEPGYGSMNLEESRIAYSVQDGFVHLRGRLVLNNQDSELPVNTTVNFMTLPTSVMPKRAKYFTVYGGNSTSDFYCARIHVPNADATDPRVEFCRYGGNASSQGERYLSLNDVFYGLDD